MKVFVEIFLVIKTFKTFGVYSILILINRLFTSYDKIQITL